MPGVNSTLSVGNVTYGEMANYTCYPGHVYRSGSLMRMCGADGNWTGAPLVCEGGLWCLFWGKLLTACGVRQCF